MKILLGFFLIISQVVCANNTSFENDEIVYRIHNKLISFIKHKKKKYLISLHCGKKERRCQASQILSSSKNISLSKGSLLGGKNPGAFVCRTLKEARVVFGRDLMGNQQSFCQFNDGSLLSSGILESLIK